MIIFYAIELIYSICLLSKKAIKKSILFIENKYEYLGGIRYVNYS